MGEGRPEIPPNFIYGLGSGCYAEPRVGVSIRSKHNVRNKFVKTEDRSNECEHLIPESTKREVRSERENGATLTLK